MTKFGVRSFPAQVEARDARNKDDVVRLHVFEETIQRSLFDFVEQKEDMMVCSPLLSHAQKDRPMLKLPFGILSTWT
jgi:hypothetical protein